MRIIAKLEIKNNQLFKGQKFEGIRYLGDPLNFIKKYYSRGVDELFILFNFATLHSYKVDYNFLKKITDFQIPIVSGGNVSSKENTNNILFSGADRVVINTAAVKNINLLKDLNNYFGFSTISLSLYVRKNKDKYFIYTNNCRDNSGFELNDFLAHKFKNLNNEIFLNSIEHDGMIRGLDYELLEYVNGKIKVPLIISGGFSDKSELKKLRKYNFVKGVCIASALHYDKVNIKDLC